MSIEEIAHSDLEVPKRTPASNCPRSLPTCRAGPCQIPQPAPAARATDNEEPTHGVDPEAEAAEPLHALESQLLIRERFGLASLLHQDPAHAAARRLAAYQARMTSATGELAAAFAEDQPLITRDALGDDRTGQLLAWASTARIAVVAPASGAAAILAELGPCVADFPGLTKVGQELATASLSGAIALPEHIEDVSAQHQAAASVNAAIAQAPGPCSPRSAASSTRAEPEANRRNPIVHLTWLRWTSRSLAQLRT